MFPYYQIFSYFNSQPHEEADSFPLRSSADPVHFNSQPHEEADFPSCIIVYIQDYFNSQPHEEADHLHPSLSDRIHISTHSLMKRLTRENASTWRIRIISTHSLMKRLTITYPFGLSRIYISTHSLMKRLTEPLYLLRKFH